MKILIPLLFSILVVVRAPPPPKVPEWWARSKALTLKSGSFDQFVGKAKFSFIQFCTTTRPECAKFAPEFEKVVEAYIGPNAKRRDVLIAKIDAWTYTSIAQDFDVKGLPDVLFFNKDTLDDPERYKGDMKADKMIEWLENKINELTPEPETPKEEKKEDEKPATDDEVVDQGQVEDEPEKVELQEDKKEAKPVKPPQPKPTKPQANQAQAQTQDQEQQKTESENENENVDESKKELKIVLNTTLLQAQFDGVQSQIKSLETFVASNNNENKKSLHQVNTEIQSNKLALQSLTNLVQELENKLTALDHRVYGTTKDIHEVFKTNLEKNLNPLKTSIETVKARVSENKVVKPQESNFGQIVLYLGIGIGLGTALGYFLSNLNGQKRVKKGYLVD